MFTASQSLFFSKFPIPKDEQSGWCYVCGGQLYSPTPLKNIIKPTFSDFSNMHHDSDKVCIACQWFMEKDKREDLQEWLHREKPQSPRTYSHILKDGTWHIYSKAQKADILSCLLTGYIPEVCIISVSGQKHLFYLARVNPPNQTSGWVLYELEQEWINQAELSELVFHVSELYLPQDGYNKQSILTGKYVFNKNNNVDLYLKHEPFIKQYRGSILLDLAVYLVTKEKDEQNE